MAGLRITLRGERNLTRAYRRELERMSRRVRRGVEDALRDLRRLWARGVRVRSGAYRRSIRVDLSEIHRSRGRVATDSPYAAHEEYSTRPHVIRPRRARVLRFVAENGDVVFTREVSHPGTRGSRALRLALDVQRRVLKARIKRHIQR